MSIGGDMNGDHYIDKANALNFSYSLRIPFFWSSVRNSNETYRSFEISEAPFVRFTEEGLAWSNRLSLQRDFLRYKENQLKYGINFGLSNQYWKGDVVPNAFPNDVDDYYFYTTFRATAFLGMGRLESAEDALLATWIYEDLLEAGVVTQASPEEIEGLARVITNTIGRRVFDSRRLRIFELRQLNDYFIGKGLDESFELFAVLNDNWAFAQRWNVPTRSIFKYGLKAGSGYESIEIKHPLKPLEYRDYQSYTAGLFTSWNKGKILGTNKASNTLIQLDFRFIDRGSEFFIVDEIPDFGLKKFINSSINFYQSWSWFPNSRMLWSISPSCKINYIIPTESILIATEANNSIQIDASVGFSMRYLFSYNWSLQAFVANGTSAIYNQEEWYVNTRPDIGVTTVWFLK